jgi:hypothetical protein
MGEFIPLSDSDVEKIIKADDRIKTYNSYIAWLDILGFSKMVKRYQWYIETYRYFLDCINSNINIIENEGYLNQLNSKIHIKIFSDSIILFTEDVTINDFVTLAYYSAMFLLNLFLKGFPLRGSIVKGKLHNFQYKDKFEIDTYIGHDLLKAIELEESQLWSGCIIDKDCFNDKNEIDDIFKKFNNKHDFILEYDVPFFNKKNEKYTEKYYVINWINKDFEYLFINYDLINNRFNEYKKEIENSHEILLLHNTEEFASFVLKQSN